MPSSRRSRSPEHGIAALVWNVSGKSELALIELATGKPLPAPPLPRELIASAGRSRRTVSGSPR